MLTALHIDNVTVHNVAACEEMFRYAGMDTPDFITKFMEKHKIQKTSSNEADTIAVFVTPFESLQVAKEYKLFWELQNDDSSGVFDNHCKELNKELGPYFDWKKEEKNREARKKNKGGKRGTHDAKQKKRLESMRRSILKRKNPGSNHSDDDDETVSMNSERSSKKPNVGEKDASDTEHDKDNVIPPGAEKHDEDNKGRSNSVSDAPATHTSPNRYASYSETNAVEMQRNGGRPPMNIPTPDDSYRIERVQNTDNYNTRIDAGSDGRIHHRNANGSSAMGNANRDFFDARSNVYDRATDGHYEHHAPRNLHYGATPIGNNFGDHRDYSTPPNHRNGNARDNGYDGDSYLYSNRATRDQYYGSHPRYEYGSRPGLPSGREPMPPPYDNTRAPYHNNDDPYYNPNAASYPYPPPPPNRR